MNKEEVIEILSEMRSEYNLFGDEEEATRYHVLSWAIKEMNAAPVVRCRDCKHRTEFECPMFHVEWNEWKIDFDDYDYTVDDGFCDRGERKTNADDKR